MEVASVISQLCGLFSCPLCRGFLEHPLQIPSCSHTFCRNCILSRLEGKGITKSECPECHMPVWKKDLVHNSQYASIAAVLKRECGQTEGTATEKAAEKPTIRKIISPANRVPLAREQHAGKIANADGVRSQRRLGCKGQSTVPRRKSRFGPTRGLEAKHAAKRQKILSAVAAESNIQEASAKRSEIPVRDPMQEDAARNQSREGSAQDQPYLLTKELEEIEALQCAIERLDRLISSRSGTVHGSGPQTGFNFEFSILGSCGEDGMARPSRHMREARQQQMKTAAKLDSHPREKDPIAGSTQEKQASLPLSLATEASMGEIDAALKRHGYRESALPATEDLDVTAYTK